MGLETIIKALEAGEITPIDLVEASIERIEARNHEINAVVETRFEKAREEAINTDYSQTQFRGIPILIKSLGHDLEGEPSTAAAKLLKGNIARSSNAFVKKIQDLGFIVLGQTNSPEFGFKNITDSSLYGDAFHPFDHQLTPGGSSGGAASALVYGFTELVAASDGGGSIRIPASHCGLIGMKPTRGSMPVGPSYRGWQGASMNFFMTRSVADTKLLFDAMFTQQDEAPFMTRMRPQFASPGKIAYSYKDPFGKEVSPEARAAMDKTIRLCQELGYEMIEDTPKIDQDALMRSYYLVNGVETVSMFKGIEKALGRKITIKDVALTTWCLYQFGLDVKGYEVVDCLNAWDQTAALMDRFHENYDFFLTPTNAHPAPAYNEAYQDDALLQKMALIEHLEDKYDIVWKMFEESLAITPFTMLANITGQPSISLPLYMSPEQRAMGVMFTAAKGRDHDLLAIAKQLEKDFEFYDL